MSRFQQVLSILDTAIGGPGANFGAHGAFWRGLSRDQFVSWKVFGVDLLTVGDGAGSNLVKALRGQAPFGADLPSPPPGAIYDRMPAGLSPVSATDIAFIEQWINDGCPAQDAALAGAVRVVTGALAWRPTNAPTASSRTDDIWFLTPDVGWAVNSNGQIIKTVDGGNSWVEQLHDPAVYFRCIGFASATRGWCGTLSPGKTLYETSDGGTTWTLVNNLPALAPSANCGISVVNENVVYLSGTNFPNKPPRMMKTVDGGATWQAWDMRPWASILIDTYFTTPDRGWVVGGKTDQAVPTRQNVKPVVLFTEDGGRTWQNRIANLQAALPLGEWGWKIQFLNEQTGFVSLENLNDGAILRTDDGGLTWKRLPVNDPQKNANLEGVGFVDANHGWVGGWGDAQFQRRSTSETTDGGRTWRNANEVGRAINRFRFFGNPVTVGYASGLTVYKYSTAPVPAAQTARPLVLLSDNESRRVTGPFQFPVTVPAGTAKFSVRVWDRFGELVDVPVDESRPVPGPRNVQWHPGARPAGYYIVRVTADHVSESRLVNVRGAANSAKGNRSARPTVGVNGSHVMIAGSARTPVPGAKVIGKADADRQIEVTIKVRRKEPLPAWTGRTETRLSRAEAASKYGASTDDLAKVKQVLQEFGLETLHSDPANRSLDVSGTIADMERAFDVKLMRYEHSQGTYRGRTGMVHVPTELDGIVTGVYGLDNRRVVRRRRQFTAAPRALSSVSLEASTHRGFTPADLAGLYGFPDGDGAGQTIGIVEFGGQILHDDLELFAKRLGLDFDPNNVQQVDVLGGAQDTSGDPSIEVMLDIEIVVGLCPKATIPVYFGPTFDERSWVKTISHAIHDQVHSPTVLSISWGNSEDGPGSAWTGTAIQDVNDTFHEAAMLGVTVCVSSGDDGSDDQGGDGHAHVDYPGSSAYVLSVGGTDLRARNGAINSETAWKDGDGLRQDGGGSSGGGVSGIFARPTWQTGINTQSVNPGAIVGRVVPDVSAHAETDLQTTGYFFVINGQNQLEGGTSAAAPLWAGLIGRVNAQRASQGKGPVGYLTPELYALRPDGSTLGSAICRDITVGDNITATVGGYRAAAGYDPVTGWGSPNGTSLSTELEKLS